MKTTNALAAGAAGAASLNLLHETARKLIPNAPRVELMAMRAVQRFVLDPMGKQLSREQLYATTLAGDLVSNSLYYAAVVGAGKKQDPKSVWKRAWFWGLGAGLLTVISPPLAKLGQQPTRNLPATAVMTTAWYLIGALAAAAVYTKLSSQESERGVSVSGDGDDVELGANVRVGDPALGRQPVAYV